MKRIHSDQFVELPAVTLYRDDLEEILSLISQGGPVRISDGEFEFDSLEELARKRGSKPQVVELLGTLGIGLKICRFKPSSLGAWGADPARAAAYLQVRELLRRRRTILARVFVWQAWLPLAVVLFGLDRAARTIVVSHTAVGIISWLFTASLVGLLLAQIAQSGAGSTANLLLRHETSTFWNRNGEKLALALLSAIAGVCVKALWDLVVAYFRAN